MGGIVITKRCPVCDDVMDRGKWQTQDRKTGNWSEDEEWYTCSCGHEEKVR
jgi:hypothetical protein